MRAHEELISVRIYKDGYTSRKSFLSLPGTETNLTPVKFLSTFLHSRGWVLGKGRGSMHLAAKWLWLKWPRSQLLLGNFQSEVDSASGMSMSVRCSPVTSTVGPLASWLLIFLHFPALYFRPKGLGSENSTGCQGMASLAPEVYQDSSWNQSLRWSSIHSKNIYTYLLCTAFTYIFSVFMKLII